MVWGGDEDHAAWSLYKGDRGKLSSSGKAALARDGTGCNVSF